MKKLKGITPIIAILVMLLITIAITGSAWIYISTYYSGMTGKAIEVTSIDCTSTGVSIYIHNIGTDTLDTGADVDEDRIMVSGSCYGNDTAAPWDEYITYDPPTLGPGDSGIANDWHCNSSDDGTARYTLIAGGRVQKVQVSC
jgi:flagellin-like protein